MYSDLPPRDSLPLVGGLDGFALPSFQNQSREPPPTLDPTNLSFPMTSDGLLNLPDNPSYPLLSVPSLMSGQDRGLEEIGEGRGLNDSILMTQALLDSSRIVMVMVVNDDGDDVGQ